MIYVIYTLAILSGLMVFATFYLVLLAVIGLLFRQEQPVARNPYRFLILIPAHNEGEGIIPTIDSLKNLDERHESKIVLIADNCDDNTASLAHETGIEVVERNNTSQRGKGYALQWAMEQFDLKDFDAVGIVDADTIVEPNMLETMAGLLAAGASAVQLNYLFVPVGNKPMSHLQHIASLVENFLFYKPRALMNMAGLLRGSGMAIDTDTLIEHPWDSHSITEDVDFSVKLLRAGHTIEFTTTSSVYSYATTDYDQASTQKSRWASGSFALIVDHFFPLIFAGLTGKFKLIEFAVSLFLMSRPLLIYIAGFLALSSWILLGSAALPLVILNLVVAGIIVLYLMSGTFLVPDRTSAIKAWLHLPRYGIWFLWVQLKSLFRLRRSDWKRTERKPNE